MVNKRTRATASSQSLPEPSLEIASVAPAQRVKDGSFLASN
jgi:hypothetical protein